MDKYLGLSYVRDEDDWTESDYRHWRMKHCRTGKHLWDEVLSVDDHYLFCDACGKITRNFKIKVEIFSPSDI